MRYLYILSLLLFFPALATAEVKIIEMKHRPAADLVEQVRTLLDDDEKVQEAGSHLVLVADGESLVAAEKLILLLDRQLKTLIVQLKYQESQQRVANDNSTVVRYSTEENTSTSLDVSRRLSNSNIDSQQSIRVLEGEGGWLEVGRDIPYTSEWSVFSGDITGYTEKINYKKIAVGFWVRPEQILADSVVVVIVPQFNRLESNFNGGPPQIRFNQLSTRLQLPFGEWYPLASHLHQTDRVSRAIISWRSHSGKQDQEIFIRIDPAKGFSP